MRTPTRCRTTAQAIGEATAQVVETLLEVNALYRLRAAQGVLRLVDKYGPVRPEAACRKAVDVGDPSYRTVKGVLAARLEHDPAPTGTGDGGAAAFLRGPSQLFAGVVPLLAATDDAVADTGTTNEATAVPLKTTHAGEAAS